MCKWMYMNSFKDDKKKCVTETVDVPDVIRYWRNFYYQLQVSNKDRYPINILIFYISFPILKLFFVRYATFNHILRTQKKQTNPC